MKLCLLSTDGRLPCICAEGSLISNFLALITDGCGGIGRMLKSGRRSFAVKIGHFPIFCMACVASSVAFSSHLRDRREDTTVVAVTRGLKLKTRKDFEEV